MARKYDTVDIGDFTYELHSVKADDKKIGSVPVRAFTDPQDYRLFVEHASDGELELIITDWKYGNGVRLQGMARKCASGEGFSDAAMNQTYAALTKDECLQFHKDHAGLVKFCKERWAKMQADGAADVDEKKVWEELL